MPRSGYLATLCDSSGAELVGADGRVYCDGRFNLSRKIDSARKYRELFRAHFPHKFAFWTHVKIQGKVYPL
jgi:hypothetical protein